MIQFDPSTMTAQLLMNSEELGGRRYWTLRIWNDDEPLYLNDLVVPLGNIIMLNEQGGGLINEQKRRFLKNILSDLAMMPNSGRSTEVLLIDGELYVAYMQYWEPTLIDLKPFNECITNKTVIRLVTWRGDKDWKYYNIYNIAQALTLKLNDQGCGRYKNYTRIAKYKPAQVRESTTITEEEKQYILANIKEYYALFSAENGVYIGLFPRKPIPDNEFTDEQIENINHCLAVQYGLANSSDMQFVRLQRQDFSQEIQTRLQGVKLC